MSSEIPQIPQPVPFTFRKSKDKTYTTVYQAVDFPLDHFAVLKQNPVNRDRVTEANKILYSLQKQINQLREALIDMAVTIDSEVEKKVKIGKVTVGNEELGEVDATLLDGVYTFTIPKVEFGSNTSIDVVAVLDETAEKKVYLVKDGETNPSCAEGAVDVEIKGVAGEAGTEGKITIDKAEEPSTYTLTGKLLKSGEQDPTDITITITDMTAKATFESALASGDKITLTLSAGYAIDDTQTQDPTAGEDEWTITVKDDETSTSESTREYTIA